ncbi:MAG TPA: formate/nitrite transporter family protein, partial [Gemmatirosa sp.]
TSNADADPADRRDPDAPAPEQPAASVQTPAVGTRLSAAEIHDNVVVAADEEMGRPAAELALSAFQAGLMIGFSLLAASYLASLVGPEHRAAAAAAGYPLGFIFVVLARSQLFTENTLDPLLPLLERRDQQTLRGVLRLWGIVLPGNVLGALVFALLAAHTPMIDGPLQTSLHSVAEHATAGGFGIVFYRAIFGGWLVALMAWLVASTSFTGAQILFVWLTTAPIAAFGFRHAIAGAAEAFYQAASGQATWGEMIGAFLVPAILGNIVGGGVLVALLNHGQVLSRLGRRMRRRRGEAAPAA